MSTTSSSRMAKFGRKSNPAITELLDDKRCVLSIRGSTADQQLTLEAQEFEGRQWAERVGLTVAAVFIDSGASASKPVLKRTEARAALELMKREGISTFAVLGLDRAFRDRMDFHTTIDHLLNHGYNFRMMSPDLDLRGAVGRMVAGFLVELAQFELSNRSERQTRCFESMRRSKVARCQNPPFGWDLGMEIPGKLSKSEKPYRTVIPNAAEQTILREIIAMHEQQQMKLDAIAAELNQRGIPTKRAGQIMKRDGKEFIVAGTWKREHVKSVIAHAELAPPQPCSGGL